MLSKTLRDVYILEMRGEKVRLTLGNASAGQWLQNQDAGLRGAKTMSIQRGLPDMVGNSDNFMMSGVTCQP